MSELNYRREGPIERRPSRAFTALSATMWGMAPAVVAILAFAQGAAGREGASFATGHPRWDFAMGVWGE